MLASLRRIHLRCSASRHLEPLGLSSVGASTCRGRSAGVHCCFKGWLCPHPPRCWRPCTRRSLPDAGSALPASGSVRDCAPLLRVCPMARPWDSWLPLPAFLPMLVAWALWHVGTQGWLRGPMTAERGPSLLPLGPAGGRRRRRLPVWQHSTTGVRRACLFSSHHGVTPRSYP